MSALSLVVTIALLALWLPVVLASFMGLADSPRYNPTWTAYLIVIAIDLYPALIGAFYLVRRRKFLFLPPGLFLALTILIPVAVVTFLYAGSMIDKLHGINPSGYSVTRDAVYWNAIKIEGADPASFAPLNADYSKDRNHVYFYTHAVEGADPATFQTMPAGGERHDFDAVDKNHRFRGGRVSE